MEYSLSERNEVAALSLADELTYARKIDDIGPNAQVAGESNTAHLMIELFARAQLDEVKVKRFESQKGSFRASAELGISSNSQI